jgi:hypothetical protein
MENFKSALIGFLLITLYSCATGYRPLGLSGGYSSKRLQQDQYKVVFKGNQLTSREQVEDYLFKRCAELTLEKGHRFFSFVTHGKRTDSTAHIDYSNKTHRRYRKSRNKAGDLYFRNKHTAVAIIKMHKDKNRAPPNSYDAKDYLAGSTD